MYKTRNSVESEYISRAGDSQPTEWTISNEYRYIKQRYRLNCAIWKLKIIAVFKIFLK